MIKNKGSRSSLTRRTVLAAGLASAAQLALKNYAWTEAVRCEVQLKAGYGKAAIAGPRSPETLVWSFNGTVPGPEIRVRQGDRLRVMVENSLAEETTVHWHGIRVPNRMDGVPHVTQPPIRPGETFTYEFDVPDAGTYWYHSHLRGFEQVGRGLAGPLIVEERQPIEIDRDVVWVIRDWRLREDATITDDFGDLYDISGAGRLGNVVTVNGKTGGSCMVRAGERVRLRLINTANARIFGLAFEDHRPRVIAIDGQPVEPHSPHGGRVMLGPGTRLDLLLDMTGAPGRCYAVEDTFNNTGSTYQLIELTYEDREPLKMQRRSAPILLPRNPLREPNLSTSERHEVVLGGGIMGGLICGSAEIHGTEFSDFIKDSLVWTMNGVAAAGHHQEPMAVLKLGSSHVIELRNETEWWHPMHLHGHTFRVLSKNGEPTRYREWQDTILLAPGDRAEVAFVADNLGDWLFHCHVLEHHAGGLMGIIRVM